jgi:RNA polymerase sigma factor (sigma-70 family)
LSINVRGLFEDIPRVVTAQAEERSIEQAQRDIYDSHRHRIFSLAFHMTGNELQAEELLTSSFVCAFEANPKPDSEMIDSALIAGLRSQFQLTPAAPAAVTLFGSMDGRNIRRTDLEEAIQELPPFERLTFLMRDVEGYSPEAIARLLDSSISDINRTLFSARIRLRSILADMDEERAA